jgi:hypothetical protein
MFSSSWLLVCLLTVRLKLRIYPSILHASRENSAPRIVSAWGFISANQLSHTADGGLMMAYAGINPNVYAMRKTNRRPVKVSETDDLAFETDTSDASETSDDGFSFFFSSVWVNRPVHPAGVNEILTPFIPLVRGTKTKTVSEKLNRSSIRFIAEVIFVNSSLQKVDFKGRAFNRLCCLGEGGSGCWN